MLAERGESGDETCGRKACWEQSVQRDVANIVPEPAAVEVCWCD